MCDVGHTCGEDTTRNNEFFIACRQQAPDVSRLGRDLARILLCNATTVVVVFSSLVARFVRSFLRVAWWGLSAVGEFHRYPLRVQQSERLLVRVPQWRQQVAIVWVVFRLGA